MLSSVLPWERMSEERLVGQGWAEGLGLTPECPTGDTVGLVLGVGEGSLTFIVRHGLLCYQLNATSCHYVMELVQEQEPGGAKGMNGEGREEGGLGGAA